MNRHRHHFENQGFTLVELVLIIVLVGILSAVTYNSLQDNDDTLRYELTRKKMEIIRDAILGDSRIDSTGRRSSFGFTGDMGRLPSSLSELVNSVSPAWSLSTAEGVGAGWRGPYVSTEDQGTEGITRDKFLNSFVYTTSSTPNLTSFGADGAAAGSGFSSDLTMNFSTLLWQGRIDGFVMEGTRAKSGKTVEIRFPSNGSMSLTSTTTDSNGAFSFSGIPMGWASLRVTGSPAMGPKVMRIDNAVQVVPSSTFNYFNQLESVTYNTGSITYCCGGSGKNAVAINLASTYSTAKYLSALTLYWDRSGTTTEGYVQSAKLYGSNITSASGFSSQSGTRILVSNSVYIPANYSSAQLYMSFSDKSGGSGSIDMSTAQFTAILEWRGTLVRDNVSFP